MIDLHMHTTASDGRSTPSQLVTAAVALGITTLAVTDHDTTGAWEDVSAAARAVRVTCVPGIEITAVADGRDVHMLGYFFDPHHPELIEFLEQQRIDRKRRVHEIGDRLARLGVPVDLEAALASGQMRGRALGRPVVAAALIQAGHVADIKEAFDRFLSEGQPAFIERMGISPVEVVSLLARAGGVTSMAHPGKTKKDHLIPDLIAAGLQAIEVYHPDHDEETTARYRALADKSNLIATGGSDYHGPGSERDHSFGQVQLPAADFARLAERAGRA